MALVSLYTGKNVCKAAVVTLSNLLGCLEAIVRLLITSQTTSMT